jgi:integrase
VAAEVAEDPPLAELTPRLVRRWLMERRTELRPASVAAYVRPLRAFSRWCAREFGIAEPLARLRAPRVELEPLVLFRPEQLRALLDGAGLHLAYAITLLLGMPAGAEALRTTIADTSGRGKATSTMRTETHER